MPTGPSPTLPIPGDSTTQIILAVASNRPMACPLEIRDCSSHPFSPTEVNDTAKLLEARYSVGPLPQDQAPRIVVSFPNKLVACPRGLLPSGPSYAQNRNNSGKRISTALHGMHRPSCCAVA